MITTHIRKIFEENLWFLATYSDGPNVVPVGFKCITEDGKFAVGAVLLETTLENIKQNGQVAIAAADPITGEAYQIKGIAYLLTKGAVYNHYVNLAEATFKGACPLKCAVIIEPEHIIIASPNEQNKKEVL